jgi:hypothetical protein
MAIASLSINNDYKLQSSDRVLLKPRPYARFAGILVLVPLLPQRRSPPALPADVWRRILAYVIVEVELPRRMTLKRGKEIQKDHTGSKWKLAMICKNLNVSNRLLRAQLYLIFEYSVLLYLSFIRTARFGQSPLSRNLRAI